jgi:hypothetical protein
MLSTWEANLSSSRYLTYHAEIRIGLSLSLACLANGGLPRVQLN